MVTTKMDLREVAAQLPEVPHEEEAQSLEEETATGEIDGADPEKKIDDEE